MMKLSTLVLTLLVGMGLFFSVIAVNDSGTADLPSAEVPSESGPQEQVIETPSENTTPHETTPSETVIEIPSPPAEETIPAEPTPSTPIDIPLSEPTLTLPVEIPSPVPETAPNNTSIEQPAPGSPTSGAIINLPVIELPVAEEPLTEVIPRLMKTVVNLVLNKVSVFIGELVKIKAYLTDENNLPLPDQTIDFYANDQAVGSDVTDEQGLAGVFWDTTNYPPGTYVIKAQYGGNNLIEGTSGTGEITLQNSPAAENSTREQLTAAAIVMSGTGPVKKMEDCQTITWQEEERVPGTCTGTRPVVSCDETNTTCTETLEEYTYICAQTQTVQKSRQNCMMIGYTIDNGVRAIQLNTKRWSCTIVEETASRIVMDCDSRNDGNGDGYCSSGESCQRIIVDGSTISTLEKNSRDDFVETDDSFFTDPIAVEVLR